MDKFIMGMLAGGFVTLVAMCFASVSSKNSIMEENKQLEDENKELRYDNEELRYAESRAVDYARRLRQIEDIIFGQGTIVDKHDAIVKLLKGGN